MLLLLVLFFTHIITAVRTRWRFAFRLFGLPDPTVPSQAERENMRSQLAATQSEAKVHARRPASPLCLGPLCVHIWSRKAEAASRLAGEKSQALLLCVGAQDVCTIAREAEQLAKLHFAHQQEEGPSVFLCGFVHVFVCGCVSMCPCVHASVRPCVRASVRPCVCVFVSVCPCVRVCTQVHESWKGVTFTRHLQQFHIWQGMWRCSPQSTSPSLFCPVHHLWVPSRDTEWRPVTSFPSPSPPHSPLLLPIALGRRRFAARGWWPFCCVQPGVPCLARILGQRAACASVCCEVSGCSVSADISMQRKCVCACACVPVCV